MAFTRDEIERLIFSEWFGARRYTQDSPIYPDVWLEYFFKEEDRREDLILTPHREYRASQLLNALRDRLKQLGDYAAHPAETPPWELANSGASVATKLTFDELIRAAIPLTTWWQNITKTIESSDEFSKMRKAKSIDAARLRELSPDYAWLRQMAGAVLWSQHRTDNDEDAKLADLVGDDTFGLLFDKKYDRIASQTELPPCLWSVSLNRKATHSLSRSVPLTKADATRRLFDVDGSGIYWAIIDSGIDARHPAFRKIINPDDRDSKTFADAMGAPDDPKSNHTRIVATYDFTRFRELMARLEGAVMSDVDENDLSLADIKDALGVTGNDNDDKLSDTEIEALARELTRSLRNGRLLDWTLISPLLRVAHNKDDYKPPKHPHGTHVAGILGADARHAEKPDKALVGMCPGIQMYDLRVTDARGEGEEFNILAALQFVRWLNVQKDQLLVHGVNLSLSMPHAVVNYACGRTPVCDECQRLVAEGAVVVAAAGNRGRTLYENVLKDYDEGFRTISITDPGNAEAVITVGSTHKSSPHSYGVSYFSSRGPTGDGRSKPDLLAPGEKIISTALGDGTASMDGTSMAAPHVSGAAALLMDRHRELIGQPQRVKEILCKSAVDIGRERYFQGYGLVDTLRALQNV